MTFAVHAEWHAKLLAYKKEERPNLRILDSYDSVMQLSNRISMLDPVREGLTLIVSHIYSASLPQSDMLCHSSDMPRSCHAFPVSAWTSVHCQQWASCAGAI